MAETKKKKAQSVADSPSSISESSTPGIETAAKPGAETAVSDQGPSESEIARRAYEIYLARGDDEGSAEGDWLQAERELARSGG